MFTKNLFDKYIKLPDDMIDIIYNTYKGSFKKPKNNCVFCNQSGLNYYEYLEGVGPICGICQFGL